MLEQGIPLEAIITELVLSGEVERTYRLLRREGLRARRWSTTHRRASTASCHAPSYYDATSSPYRPCGEIVEDIRSGRFADEWDAERDAGHPTLERLEGGRVPEEMAAWEQELRSQLGEGVSR